MVSMSGCTKEICEDRTLFGFLICDESLVEERDSPNQHIRVSPGPGPNDQRAGDMYAGETFVAGSVGDGDPFLPGDYIANEEWDIDGLAGYEQHFPYGGSSVARFVADPQLLTIRLRATDQEGNVGFSERTLHVVPRGIKNESEAPPGVSITADPNPARVGQLVRFDASTTNSLTDTVSWDLDGQPGYEYTDPSGFKNAYHTFWRPGEYTIGAQVLDAAGRTAEHSVLVVVQGAGGTTPPIATFSVRPNPAMPEEQIRFDGSGSHDPDGGELLRWEWDIFDRPGVDIDEADRPLITTSYFDRSPGFLPLFLRVTDDDGDVHTQEQTLQFEPKGTYSPPTADMTVNPNPATVGQPVTFDASGSTDADGSVLRYEWDLDGASTQSSHEYEVDTGSTSSIVHTFSQPTGVESGIRVGVRVTDDDGRQATFETFMRVRPGEHFAPRPVVQPAARTTTTRLFAKLDLPKLLSAGRTRGKSSLTALRLRGRVSGKLLKPNGEEATSSPAVLGRLLRGKWSAQLDLTRRGNGHAAGGLALATAPGRKPAHACLRLSLKTGKPKDGRTPILGSFRVLGGDRAAAGLRASGKFGLEIRPDGYAVAAGNVTSAAGKARKMPAACRRLAKR